MKLITQEQHDMMVKDLGFKKVNFRCPVCYVESVIKENIRKEHPEFDFD